MLEDPQPHLEFSRHRYMLRRVAHGYIVVDRTTQEKVSFHYTKWSGMKRLILEKQMLQAWKRATNVDVEGGVAR